MFHIILVHPEIPPNTGNIGRLCLATGAQLHLIQPLGFDIDDRALRRAGLDYWQHLDVKVWENFTDYLAAYPNAKKFSFSTKSEQPHWHADFPADAHMIFGAETRGLPSTILADPTITPLTIPMPAAATKSSIRSLNLATSVGIALYEGIRQNRTS